MAATPDMARQVRWMMALRALIVTSLFLPTSLLFYEELMGGEPSPAFGITLRFLAAMMAVTYGLTLLYAVLVRRIRNMAAFALWQIAVDIGLETVIVYYSGVVTTPFLVLYLVSIIAASILLDRRGALGVASLAVLAYLTLLNLVYWGILPLRSSFYEDVMSIPINETLYYIFVSLSGFLATSLLVNYISERSRRVREQLREVGDELSELQSFNERVIDNISSGLLVLSPEGTITYVNLPGAAIVGYEPAELKGLPLTAVYAGGDGLLADAPPHLERRKIFRFEDAFLSRAGVLIPVGGSLTSLPDIRGGRAGFVLIFQDLTELKKLEGEVRLREKLSAVGSLAAGIAHEIRNPLASMSGSVQLLRAELALTGDQRRLMDILVDESRRLSRIIQDFLTYARPQKPHLETVRLSELLEQTLILLEHSEERKEAHELLVERGTADDRVLADAGQIKQVFWNLSLNALSAMPRGGRLTIRLDADRPESVRVVFVDQGHGISKQRLETLFTPFNSGSPARLGLGLSIVYGILREHEGTIAVESEEGRGTKITIELPRRLVPESVKAAVR